MSCPGWYCGKTYLENGELSDCGSCPRGYRRNDTTFICEPCLDSPKFYDWLFLGFMGLVVLILHWFFIDMVSMRRSFCKNVIVLHLTAFFEVLISCTLTLLFTNPAGHFTVYSCPVRTVSDWYTLFYNPTPNYDQKIYCTQEAVFPLYSIIFLFYILSLISMLLIRPWVSRKYLPRQGKMAIYAAMYFIPILVLAHATVGGLIYYAFPYLLVVVSVISSAVHFAVKMDQRHWCLHAYGIISITQLTEPLVHSLMVLLVPVPALFYILTARFTDPNKILNL
ncbi:JNK1/MAPK8-associated membrane protein isoform X2 [Cylas formicarius]|uniref:JNK1/MAPK8-associated membrane protein isoform X2 n=1 Tax=Cylas formicarius TaxID=197179 RepID=UPI0029586B51|nr:JNK1/MAPK8-associated membrane protein isoform X2 [Cylas formicarius]